MSATVSGLESCVSVNVLAACTDLADHVELLAAFASANASLFEELPADDFFVERTRGLHEPLKLFVEDFPDGSETFLHRAIAISTPGSRRQGLPWAAAVAGLLFQLGHRGVGVAVVDGSKCGCIFRFTSQEDVICQELTESVLAEGVS